MKILIFELDGSGHRFQYVRSIIDSIYELNQDITLVTSHDSLDSLEFKYHLYEIKSKFKIESYINKHTVNKFINLWESAGILIKTIKKNHPKHVYIPTANGILQLYGIRRLLQFNKLPFKSTTLEVMLMSGGIFSGWKRWVFGALWSVLTKLASCQVIHVLYPLQKEKYQLSIVSLADEILLTPEPVEDYIFLDKIKARKELGLPSSGRYIVSLGRQDKRKGIDLLLEIFNKTELQHTDRLLLAGKLDDDIKLLIYSKYGEMLKNQKIIIRDEYFTQHEFGIIICSADVICLPYIYSESSSGIAVRAAALGKLILGSNTGWMGRTVKNYELGLTCNIHDHDAFSDQLVKALDSTENYQVTEKGKQFVRYHTMVNFKAHWSKNLRNCLGLGVDSNYIAWKE